VLPVVDGRAAVVDADLTGARRLERAHRADALSYILIAGAEIAVMTFL